MPSPWTSTGLCLNRSMGGYIKNNMELPKCRIKGRRAIHDFLVGPLSTSERGEGHETPRSVSPLFTAPYKLFHWLREVTPPSMKRHLTTFADRNDHSVPRGQVACSHESAPGHLVSSDLHSFLSCAK